MKTVQSGYLDRGDIFVWNGRMFAVNKRLENFYLEVKEIAGFWPQNPDDHWQGTADRNFERFNGYTYVVQITFPKEWAQNPDRISQNTTLGE